MAQTKEGAIKVAAKKANLTVIEYVEHITNGLKKCSACQQWKKIENFCKDNSRHDNKAVSCNQCRKALWRLKNITHIKRKKRRPGDKKQARARINADIRQGLRPNPNDLYCSLCGHKEKNLRHEYHHSQGYTAQHHYDVLPLCSKCHHAEEIKK